MSWTSFVREAASAEADRVKAQVRFAIRSLVLTMTAGIFLLIGIVFALAGAYASLAEHMPDWQAGAWVGLGGLVVCLLLLALARVPGRTGGRRGRTQWRSPASGRAPRADDLEATAELGAAASTAARNFVRDHRPTGLDLMLAAFVVGMVASRSGRRRRSS